MDGLYIDDERVPYRGHIALTIDNPPRLIPAISAPDGIAVRAVKGGQTVAMFVGRGPGKRAVSPIELLTEEVYGR